MNDQSAKGDRQSPIDVSAEQFRSAGHALVDRIADLLAGMRERKVTSGLSINEVRQLIRATDPMPLEGCEFEEVVSEMTSLLAGNSLYNGHPRFLGYVTSSPAPIGMLADLLAAAVNPNCGAWSLSPVATEIEAQTIRWIAELLNYPSSCSGLMVSGGNAANFVGIYAALRSVSPRQSPARGSAQLTRARLYASSEVHTWIEKAVDMYGLPREALRTIKVDSSCRLVLEDLETALVSDLEAGCIPIAVVGTAGTVSTGAVDPLPAMAEVCRRHKVWLHVDGAYGGFAAMVDSAPDDLRGLSLADSVAIDPHKWLYAPLEAGCALVRDPAKHRAAYDYRPPYYHFSEEAINFFDYGPQNSRGFRALKVWMALKQVGRSGYVRMIGEEIALARDLHRRLDADHDFEVFSCDLSIVTFRYVPEVCRGRKGDSQVEAYLNRLNQALLARLEVSGEVFVSNALRDGRFLLRACIVNFRTSARDIAEIPAIIARYGRQVHHELSTGR